MAQFLGDIAGMLEIFAIAAGLLILHRTFRESGPAPLARAAGVVLVAGGLLAGLCTSWYWFKYRRAGDFERAHVCRMMSRSAMAGTMPHGHSMMGGQGMMQPGQGMMGGKGVMRSGRGMMGGKGMMGGQGMIGGKGMMGGEKHPMPMKPGPGSSEPAPESPGEKR